MKKAVGMSQTADVRADPPQSLSATSCDSRELRHAAISISRGGIRHRGRGFTAVLHHQKATAGTGGETPLHPDGVRLNPDRDD